MSSAAVRSKPYFRKTTQWDIAELALTMRQEDVEEIFHASRGSPLGALVRGSEASTELISIVKQSKVVAIFGLVGTKGVSGSPWMLGTDELPKCKSLLRDCRKIVQRYLEEYKYLSNACWSKNDVHIEWIKWLGFTFEGEDIRNGETFLHFHKEFKCVNQQR